MLPVLALMAAALLVGFLYGALLKVSDLLQEHGFRWAGRERGDVVAGFLTTLFGLGLLLTCSADARVFWMAVILSWVLRGRIDGINHGVMAFAMALFILLTTPPAWVHGVRFWYFLSVLSVLGLLHDLFQYTKAPAPRSVRWFFEQQHLYWYLLAIGYLLLFARDFAFAAGVYGFVKGYGFFYDEKRRSWLARVGIRPGPA